MQKTILIVSHGSREMSANREFKRIVSQYQKRHPRWAITHAYLELVSPSIAQALEILRGKTNEIILLPYFLFPARHVKKDIPAIIQAFQKNHPKVKVKMAQPLGSDPKLLDILDKHLRRISPE